MDGAETLARVAVHQEQENPKFKFDEFIKKDMYFVNYPEEKKLYQEKVIRKRKKMGKEKTIAEEFMQIKNGGKVE